MADQERDRDGHRKSRRGFAAMPEGMQKAIAAKGGRSQGKENNPGNFANDRRRAADAGRKGGQRSRNSRGFEEEEAA